MKKTISLILALVLCLALAVPAMAAKRPAPWWDFEQSGDTLIITGNTKVALDGEDAPWDKSAVKALVIKDGITGIGWGTFEGLKNLTSVTIPASVVSIETGAFMNCKSLTDVTIPEGVTYISRNTFNGCESLETINLPKSLAMIGNYAFYGCESLETINFAGNARLWSGVVRQSTAFLTADAPSDGNEDLYACTIYYNK